ncbi:MAG: alpha/beta-type small acid-soluble spore protein [Bacilli bacterium]|nr:alpha/beta-type small acid-soluble spore protein [Bacilli bacterium]
MARSRSKLIVPGAENVLNQFKNEIASEFGITLGANSTARDNGSVGGEMTRRLIAEAKQQRVNNNNNPQNNL